MPFYRLTGLFQFGGQPPCGFSESWDFDAVDDTLAISQANSWPKERAEILSHDWTIVTVRLSKIALVQAPVCKKKLLPVQQGVCPRATRGAIQSDADTPWAAILIAIATKQASAPVGGEPRPRQWQCRGIPDSWWTGVLDINVADNGKISKYCKYLKDNLQAGHVLPNAGCSALGLQPYQSCCVKRISNRQIGRPFFLLRGRRLSPALTT
jgi:hypothetical protein